MEHLIPMTEDSKFKNKEFIKNYRNIHDWIRRRMNHINKCSFCGSEKNLDNALIKGKEYKKDINNFIKLCRKCHRKYDFEIEFTHSEQTKKIISNYSKIRVKEKGVSLNFINSQKGKTLSKERKELISNNMKGENHHSAKLNNEKVIEIFNSNLSIKDLSIKFNVSKGTIKNIKNKKSWKHLF